MMMSPTACARSNEPDLLDPAKVDRYPRWRELRTLQEENEKQA